MWYARVPVHVNKHCVTNRSRHRRTHRLQPVFVHSLSRVRTAVAPGTRCSTTRWTRRRGWRTCRRPTSRPPPPRPTPAGAAARRRNRTRARKEVRDMPASRFRIEQPLRRTRPEKRLCDCSSEQPGTRRQPGGRRQEREDQGEAALLLSQAARAGGAAGEGHHQM